MRSDDLYILCSDDVHYGLGQVDEWNLVTTGYLKKYVERMWRMKRFVKCK